MASPFSVVESSLKNGIQLDFQSSPNRKMLSTCGDRGSPHLIRSEPLPLMHSSSAPESFDQNLSIVEDGRSSIQSSEQRSDDSPSSSDNGDFKKQLARPNRDPLSHRIIEKRRRDRMNNCLTNLSKLIPSAYLKKGRGRIEKTEIIEMAIRYMKHMQDERKQLSPGIGPISNEFMKDKAVGTDESLLSSQTPTIMTNNLKLPGALMSERYKQGFYDCIAETLRFLALSEGLQINESSKTRLLVHLKDYFSRLTCDTLGPCISDLLRPKCNATSVLALPWVPRQNFSGNVQFAYDSSSSSSSPSPRKEDQPLNMSLKRARMDKGSCSQLREILTDAKDTSQQSGSTGSAATESVSVKRPHVFRYTAGMGISADFPQNKGQGSLLASAKGPLPLPAHHNQCNSSVSSGSTQYPSSPGSTRSLSGGSLAGDSPPRVVSPLGHSQHQVGPAAPIAGLPIFALHPSGMYYIPMTLNPAHLDPLALEQLSAVSSPGSSATCHPVTITVNFCHHTPSSNVQVQSTPVRQVRRMSPVGHRQTIPARDGVILAAASSTNT